MLQIVGGGCDDDGGPEDQVSLGTDQIPGCYAILRSARLLKEFSVQAIYVRLSNISHWALGH